MPRCRPAVSLFGFDDDAYDKYFVCTSRIFSLHDPVFSSPKFLYTSQFENFETTDDRSVAWADSCLPLASPRTTH